MVLHTQFCAPYAMPTQQQTAKGLWFACEALSDLYFSVFITHDYAHGCGLLCIHDGSSRLMFAALQSGTCSSICLAAVQPPKFEFYDPQSPIYTSPRFLPPAKIVNSKIFDAIISHGAFLEECSVDNAIVGLRSRIGKGATIKVMGCASCLPVHKTHHAAQPSNSQRLVTSQAELYCCLPALTPMTPMNTSTVLHNSGCCHLSCVLCIECTFICLVMICGC